MHFNALIVENLVKRSINVEKRLLEVKDKITIIMVTVYREVHTMSRAMVMVMDIHNNPIRGKDSRNKDGTNKDRDKHTHAKKIK